MTARRRAMAAVALGLAAAALYLGVVVLAGRAGPIVSHPLMDGFTGPVSYNWVSPPPALASQNKKPASGRFSVDLDPQTGSVANVFATSDNQASIALEQGSISASAGQDGATLTISPLAATGFPPPPSRHEITGNVYRIQARYRPGGAAVTDMATPAQVVLEYPAEAGSVLHTHFLLISADGKAWHEVSVIDSRTQQLIQGSASTFGYFAVARTPGGTPKGGTSVGTVLIYAILALLIVPIVVFIVRAELRMRRDRRTRGRGRSGSPTGKGSGRRRPGPRPERRSDRRSRRRPADRDRYDR